MREIPQYVFIAVELYKQNVPIIEIARRTDIAKDRSSLYYWFQKLKVWQRKTPRYYPPKTRFYKKTKVYTKVGNVEVESKIEPIKKLSPYDKFNLEPLNPGMFYKEYLQMAQTRKAK